MHSTKTISGFFSGGVIQDNLQRSSESPYCVILPAIRSVKPVAKLSPVITTLPPSSGQTAGVIIAL